MSPTPALCKLEIVVNTVGYGRGGNGSWLLRADEAPPPICSRRRAESVISPSPPCKDVFHFTSPGPWPAACCAVQAVHGLSSARISGILVGVRSKEQNSKL